MPHPTVCGQPESAARKRADACHTCSGYRPGNSWRGLLRLAFLMRTPLKLALLRSALVRSPPLRMASIRWVPIRKALLRLALLSLALLKLVLVRIAPPMLALYRVASPMSAVRRSAPLRSAPRPGGEYSAIEAEDSLFSCPRAGGRPQDVGWCIKKRWGEWDSVCQWNVHREFISIGIVTAMMHEKAKQATGEKEARKRTWQRGSQDRTLLSKAWTLKEFGGKQVWDWLQLLIVPIVLSLITLAFTWQQDARQQQIENQRAESDRRIEEQRAQDAALQAYLDQMSELLLEKELRTSEEESEVRTLARARTLTVLGRLDSRLKPAVVQF
jgi:hypothetical protein